MNTFELRQAVEQPVLSRGVRFEPGLVERLLTDVGSDPGNLPLLQFCLTQLWGRQRADTLTHAAYEDLGGLAGALSRYADRVFAQLTPEEQDEARQVLTRLVRPGEGTEDTRRWASRQELGEDGWGVVRQLADTRLVVTDRNADGREQASLAHETLLRHWDRLRDWLQEDLTFRLWRQRLTPWLQQWVTSGQDAAFLLRGLLLAEAEEWSHEQVGSFSELERSFIAASSEQRLAEERSEEARRQRELAQERALNVVEHARAEAAARGRSRLRLLAGALFLFALFATVAGGIALRQSRLAEDRRLQAVAAQTSAEEHATLAQARQLSARQCK